MDNKEKFKIVKRLVKKYGGEEVKKSNRIGKKYMVLYNGKWIHFGAKGYEDFLDHKDEKRRANYRKRASGIKNKYGLLTFKDKTSANFWAYNILW